MIDAPEYTMVTGGVVVVVLIVTWDTMGRHYKKDIHYINFIWVEIGYL